MGVNLDQDEILTPHYGDIARPLAAALAVALLTEDRGPRVDCGVREPSRA
jgi:hypothetical protein